MPSVHKSCGIYIWSQHGSNLDLDKTGYELGDEAVKLLGVKSRAEGVHVALHEIVALTPSERNWVDSGKILARMRADHGFSADKLKSLQFDALIALTARSRGARLITGDRTDFELIAQYSRFIW